MKLTTEHGDLELPKDFYITLKKTNPLMSDEGSTSLPVTLPSSTRNLAATGHRERIDSAEALPGKINATLTIGSLERHGKLIFDTVHRFDGINAVFAFDNSDLYSSMKKKPLKEIFAAYNNGQGYRQTFSSVSNACLEMEHIYKGDSQSDDYTVFPVAVAAYSDEEDNTIYQYNTEIDDNSRLVYAKRTVHEGTELVSVPEGYGVAPFLWLNRLIDILFLCLGYNVTENCFSDGSFANIAVVHNCADCLVLPVLQYKDLVPSCTLSEFLEWLEAKFHAYAVVDSNKKEVRILSAEETLKSDPESDITEKVEGNITVKRSPSKHVVIKPNCIDGSEAIAETRTAMEEKYKYILEVDEYGFHVLSQTNAPFYSYLILRLATGMYYEQCFELNTGHAVLRPAGTNYFAFDNANAEDEESYNPSDVMPLMLCDKTRVAPFIGERIHFHTAYKDKEESTQQQIIVVQSYFSTQTGYRTSGTTQGCIPKYNNGSMISLPFGLTPERLTEHFWGNYNTILLNGETTVTARLKLGFLDFNNFSMEKVKLLNGQPLLPVKISGTMSTKINPTEAEFLLIKHFENEITDQRAALSHDTTFPDECWITDFYDDLQAAAEACWPASIVENVTAVFHQRLLYIYPPPERGETREIDVIADITARVTDQGGGHTSFKTAENRTVTLHLRCHD